MTTKFDLYDPQPRRVWVNLYNNGNMSGFYHSQQEAEFYAKLGWRGITRRSVQAWMIFLPPTGDEDDNVHSRSEDD